MRLRRKTNNTGRVSRNWVGSNQVLNLSPEMLLIKTQVVQNTNYNAVASEPDLGRAIYIKIVLYLPSLRSSEFFCQNLFFLFV